VTWHLAVLLGLMAALFVAAPRFARADPASAVHVTRVQMATGQVEAYSTPSPHAPAVIPGAWTTVALPHTVRRAHAFPANAIISAWYRADIALPTSDQPTYLYLPRWQAIGHISVYADGRLVYAPRTSAKWNGFNLPTWFEVAGPATSPPSQILIHIEAGPGSSPAISSFWVGAKDALSSRHSVRTFLQLTAPEAGCAIFMLIGLVTVVLWLRRREEPAYLLIFFVATLITTHTLEYFVGSAPIWISDNWFQWSESNSELWYSTVTFLMVSYYVQVSVWARRLFVGLSILFSLVTTSLALLSISLEGFVPFFWLISLTATVVITALSWLGYRAAPSRIGFLFCLFASTLPPAGIVDILMSFHSLSIEGIYLVPLIPTVQAALFLYILADRHLTALAEAERARSNLAARLEAREKQLAATYERLRESEHQQMLIGERQRLMRDMHDGVGSSLMGALVVVERGEVDARETAQLLRDCLDDLKLAIDSLEPVDTDLLLLLATARYRLEPRFEQAGIKLSWTVEDLPPLPKITPEHALHILRIVQEVFTNIVKHAQARHVHLTVAPKDDAVAITIVDDGVGFDLAAASASAKAGRRGRGLINLTTRAAALGAHIHWTSEPGRTRVELSIPLVIETAR
jgi:signal transduction histidine kinase